MAANVLEIDSERLWESLERSADAVEVVLHPGPTPAGLIEKHKAG